jgi:hypothetical protein
MTCVPNSLISKLKNDDYKLINLETKPNANKFMEAIKKNNRKTYNITWQGYKLNERELSENVERIKNIELNKIGSGYLCSSCDPLLLLYCEIFFVGIDLNFNGIPLQYRNVKYNDRVLKFSASSSHFS